MLFHTAASDGVVIFAPFPISSLPSGTSQCTPDKSWYKLIKVSDAKPKEIRISNRHNPERYGPVFRSICFLLFVWGGHNPVTYCTERDEKVEDD
jgi:hypothetical protein